MQTGNATSFSGLGASGADQELSRSPRFTRNRNTKNLSLSISNSPTQRVGGLESALHAENPQSSQVRLQEPVSCSSDKQAPNEAHIFTLSNVLSNTAVSPTSTSFSAGLSGSTEPNDVKSRLRRGMSLPLQLKTSSSRNSYDSQSFANIGRMSSPIESQSLSLEPQRGISRTTTSWVCHKNNASISSSSSEDDNSAYSYNEGYQVNAYPEGPLLVNGSCIYLCSEPTFEELTRFDVIVNVAQEITNYQSKLQLNKQADYHYVEWSHTSKICADLPRLTQIIHQAAQANKKVLVHCQCGVSRSASLIVAYIMRYQNLPLNDAYNRLKTIAKDISPNMSLIFQLMEWNEALSTQRQRSVQEELQAVQIDPKSKNADKPDLEPLEIANIISQQNAHDMTKVGLCSPNCSSISTDNTPCTPNEFLNCHQITSNPSANGKTANDSRPMVSGPTQYSTIFESFIPSPVEIGEKTHTRWG
ncbi:LANO_0H07294g1_1 [Lachancea nothofagi CBS 11611]|uniref:protein-tyrosine-phosphatase n=1 Tax=Lachancea nothofagi CBS 11611 TaxID=1266666 RepID=A0A1G4KLS2_9SACH|nr:LANO_0H07294g1_1 [Lachancea nothofagi CBS 11611]